MLCTAWGKLFNNITFIQCSVDTFFWWQNVKHLHSVHVHQIYVFITKHNIGHYCDHDLNPNLSSWKTTSNIESFTVLDGTCWLTFFSCFCLSQFHYLCFTTLDFCGTELRVSRSYKWTLFCACYHIPFRPIQIQIKPWLRSIWMVNTIYQTQFDNCFNWFTNAFTMALSG